MMRIAKAKMVAMNNIILPLAGLDGLDPSVLYKPSSILANAIGLRDIVMGLYAPIRDPETLQIIALSYDEDGNVITEERFDEMIVEYNKRTIDIITQTIRKENEEFEQMATEHNLTIFELYAMINEQHTEPPSS